MVDGQVVGCAVKCKTVLARLNAADIDSTLDDDKEGDE